MGGWTSKLARAAPFAAGLGAVMWPANVEAAHTTMGDATITGQSQRSFSNMQQGVAAMLAEGQPLTDEQIGEIVQKHLADNPYLVGDGFSGPPAEVNPDIYGVIAEISSMAGQ